MFWRVIFVIAALLALGQTAALRFKSPFSFLQPTKPKSVSNAAIVQEPVVKSEKKPILTVVEPTSGARVHLVGVSHGSASSANLVKETMERVNPSAVVVELCDDRFFSISLDSKIRPRGNATLAASFDEKIAILEQKHQKLQSSYANFGVLAVFSQLTNTFKFASSQGFFGGLFVLLGLFVSNLQRMTRRDSGGDEFVTAMMEAERLDIPVILGDAPQNDTLNSIRSVISPAVLDPQQVVDGAKFLAFSAFGVGAKSSNKDIAKTIPEPVLKDSQWVSIPGAYAQDLPMLKSLAPLFVALFASTTLTYLPWDAFTAGPASAISAAADSTLASPTLATFLLGPLAGWLGIDSQAQAIAAASDAHSWSIGSAIMSLLTSELPPEVEMTVSSVIDVLSILVLIRMSKVIGTDRDCIIAKKIQEAAAEHPGKELVVVIGMLHCNGVARWLLSGQDPLAFNGVGSTQKN